MIPNNNTPSAARIWQGAAMNFIYTLSPTHCGIGQTAGSVDLPIARDVVTGFPILPATALKGVAREVCETHPLFKKKDPSFIELVNALFGPDLKTQEEQASATGNLKASGLAFTEGRLAAYPVRSMIRPFFHVTCPLILENLLRDARLLGDFKLPTPDLDKKQERVLVADMALEGQSLVFEDIWYDGSQVSYDEQVEGLARKLAEMMPETESDAARRLSQGLVVLPDNEFSDLIRRAVPVIARTRLTDGKTTDKWQDPEKPKTPEQSGNLWYEEYVPADTLFISFTGHRRQIFFQNTDNANNREKIEKPLSELYDIWKDISIVQIGGNETVGQGFCLWEIIPAGGGEM